MALSSNGLSAYVANQGGNDVLQFNLDPFTGALSPKSPATVATSSGEWLTLSPDGASAYVTNYSDNTVSQYNIDPLTGTLSPMNPATGATGPTPYGITVGPFPADSDLALDKPSNVPVDATSPAGATVTYTNPAAHDEDLSTVTVNCTPASGSTFAIGDTTVTCTATDTDGDTNSPATQMFNVHVKGAGEQVTDLDNAVLGVGPGTGLATKVGLVQSDLSANDTVHACGALTAFINQVIAQTGKSIPPGMGPGHAGSLKAAAQQIQAVIPCMS
jgi:hypothetical protein